MSSHVERSEPADIWDADQLVEMAIVSVEGDSRMQLESVRRLIEMAQRGERQALESLYMAGALQPDAAIYEEVSAGLRGIMETARSPEFKGIAANKFYDLESERRS